MAILSYNLSPTLKHSLKNIEGLKRKILLAPIAPSKLSQLRWETTLSRIFWTLSFDASDLNRAEITKLLVYEAKKHPNKLEKQALNLKRLQNYIGITWILSDQQINTDSMLKLHSLIYPEVSNAKRTAQVNKVQKELTHFLTYLQTGSIHPVVQAGVAQIELAATGVFETKTNQISRALAQLFLYKYGYDFRGLLVLEEFWRRDVVGLQQAYKDAAQTQNLTLWLEYFTNAIIAQLEKAIRNINSSRDQLVPPSFWELNSRQKEILSILEAPTTTITNKNIQKKFRISQITASRDLSKLARLGLLFAHGKGRSVYYTKV